MFLLSAVMMTVAIKCHNSLLYIMLIASNILRNVIAIIDNGNMTLSLEIIGLEHLRMTSVWCFYVIT